MDLKDFHVQVKKVRLRLLKNAPYFGMALIKLARVRESSIQDTAWTDGRSIVFSEEFIKEITPEQCNFVLLHELYHIILLHVFRLKDRDPFFWNLAADLKVNRILEIDSDYYEEIGIPLDLKKEFGIFELPDIYNVEDFSVEEIYSLLENNPNISKFLRDDKDAYYQDIKKFKGTLKEWQIKEGLRGLESYKGHSPIGQYMFEEVSALLSTKVPWYKLVKRFLSSAISDDTSFASPLRTTLYRKMILPGEYLEECRLADVVVAVDTSGSISKADLADFFGHINKMIKDFEMTGVIIQWSHEVYPPIPIKEYKNIKISGRGGTSPDRAQYYIRNNYSNAKLVIYLTDGDFEKIKAEKNSIWVITPNGTTENITNGIVSQMKRI